MNNSNSENITNLLKRAEELKNETEKLIQEAKDLSHEGIVEVEELVSSLKASWQNIIAFGTSFFKIGKKPKKKATKKKPAKKPAKKTVKKPARSKKAKR